MALYHSARGSVGYTIVGSPTIVDGVVSGFAGGSNLQVNYLKTQFLPDFTGDVEIGIKFKTDTWAYGVLMSWITSGISCYISINASGKPACFFSKTGANSTSLVINSTDHSFAFTTGQDCYLKVTKTTEGTLTMYHSNDGQAYTQFATKTNANYGTSRVSSYCRIGVNASYNPGQAFNGSIDLNETYINVNGQPWFGICPIEVKKHQIMGPVGYTVVGSPTITDGIASDFGQESYLISSSNLAKPLETECYARITVGQSTGNYNVFLGFTGGNYPVRYSPSYRFSFYKQNAGGWSDGVTRYAVGDLVDIRYIYKGGYLRLYTKLASAELWNEEMQLAVNSNPIYGVFYFGRSATANTQYIAGSIDLNHTYIKVNEKLWFWQPQETKRIVVNGVEVWTKPE